MKLKTILNKAVPHIVAVVVFALLATIYFSPVLDGKRLKQHDVVQYRGAVKEVSDFTKETGDGSLWTNSMFGGMPTTQMALPVHHNWVGFFLRPFTLGISEPISFIFLAFLFFYITLLCFKVDPWLSIVGALAYGLSAYFLIIIGAGHNTKMRTLAYLPLIVGGMWLVYRRQKMLLGATLTCLALGWQIAASHLQITYYTMLIVLVFLIFEFVRTYKEKLYVSFFKGSAMLAFAVAIAIGVNITIMAMTAEYTPYSTRGPSELTDKTGSNDKTSGLDRSYILNNYSYSILETLDLFIPNMVGGASVGPVSENSQYVETYMQMLTQQFEKQHNLSAQEARQQANRYRKQIAQQAPLYWGGQDGGTSGPVYIGAVVILLFVLGLFLVKGSTKWWLVSVTILAIVLAWGKHCAFIANFFIDYFPGFNKFRTVSMILVIAEFAIPLLGILGLKELLSDKLSAATKVNAVKKSLYITGGIALACVLFAGMFSLSSANDAAMQLPDAMMSALYEAREHALRMDALRSLFFVLAATAVIWFFLKGKLKRAPLLVLLGALVVIDLWNVDKRYMNNDRFTSAKDATNPIQETIADKSILQDTTLDYRVLNLNNPFNEATTSYFHKSIGGYQGAKMKRYQDLIEHRLSPEMQIIISGLSKIRTHNDIDSIFALCTSLDMLNTKYVIFNPSQPALPNTQAIGNAWSVKSIRWVDNADAEIEALNDFKPREEAVIDKRFETLLNNFEPAAEAASIRLTEYRPNYLKYEFQSSAQQLIVFSEIYYDKGWNAYIDGQLTPHLRANYVLRAMPVPEGSHTIEFKAESKTYYWSEKASLICSILLTLMVAGCIGFYAYRWLKSKNNSKNTEE